MTCTTAVQCPPSIASYSIAIGSIKISEALVPRVAKIHHATFRKCDVLNGNSLLCALQKIDCAPVACRESGTYVRPEIRHVASPSIDGFGAPFLNMDGRHLSRHVRRRHVVLTAAERLQPTLRFCSRVLAGVRNQIGN
jgi:hypothetical protein